MVEKPDFDAHVQELHAKGIFNIYPEDKTTGGIHYLGDESYGFTSPDPAVAVTQEQFLEQIASMRGGLNAYVPPRMLRQHLLYVLEHFNEPHIQEMFAEVEKHVIRQFCSGERRMYAPAYPHMDPDVTHLRPALNSHIIDGAPPGKAIKRAASRLLGSAPEREVFVKQPEGLFPIMVWLTTCLSFKEEMAAAIDRQLSGNELVEENLRAHRVNEESTTADTFGNDGSIRNVGGNVAIRMQNGQDVVSAFQGAGNDLVKSAEAGGLGLLRSSSFPQAPDPSVLKLDMVCPASPMLGHIVRDRVFEVAAIISSNDVPADKRENLAALVGTINDRFMSPTQKAEYLGMLKEVVDKSPPFSRHRENIREVARIAWAAAKETKERLTTACPLPSNLSDTARLPIAIEQEVADSAIAKMKGLPALPADGIQVSPVVKEAGATTVKSPAHDNNRISR